MAITSLDQAIAGMQPPEEFFKIGSTPEGAGIFHSFFYAAGRPGAGTANSAGMSGAALTSLSGQIPFTNPVSGNSYLARFECTSTLTGNVMLCDRLWHQSGIAVATTTAQTINSVAFPARDRNGSTSGDGIMVAIEVSTATTNASAITNTTMSYTNQAGTSGRTATIASFPATAVLGTFIPFQLQAGDTGIRSVQSITLGTSYVAGTIHLVAYRTLIRMSLPTNNIGSAVDALTGGFVRLYDNTVPFIVCLSTTGSAYNLSGQVIVTQG